MRCLWSREFCLKQKAGIAYFNTMIERRSTGLPWGCRVLHSNSFWLSFFFLGWLLLLMALLLWIYLLGSSSIGEKVKE